VPQSVVLYRMILPDHTCPFGVLCTQLLNEAGVEFEDRVLRNREEVDAFEAEHGVNTTPQCSSMENASAAPRSSRAGSKHNWSEERHQRAWNYSRTCFAKRALVRS